MGVSSEPSHIHRLDTQPRACADTKFNPLCTAFTELGTPTGNPERASSVAGQSARLISTKYPNYVELASIFESN